MAQTNVVLFGATAGTQTADTGKSKGTIVVRDPSDMSIVVGPVYADAVINPGTTTQAPGASTAAAGSTTTDAGVLPPATASAYPVTGADGTKGVRANVSDKVAGRMIFIGNQSSAVLKVYPPSGGTINGLSADAAFSSDSGKGVFLYCLDSGSNAWLAK